MMSNMLLQPTWKQSVATKISQCPFEAFELMMRISSMPQTDKAKEWTCDAVNWQLIDPIEVFFAQVAFPYMFETIIFHSRLIIAHMEYLPPNMCLLICEPQAPS